MSLDLVLHALDLAPGAVPPGWLCARTGLPRTTLDAHLAVLARRGLAHWFRVSRKELLWGRGARPSVRAEEPGPAAVEHPLAGHEEDADCAYYRPRPKRPGGACERCPDRKECRG